MPGRVSCVLLSLERSKKKIQQIFFFFRMFQKIYVYRYVQLRHTHALQHICTANMHVFVNVNTWSQFYAVQIRCFLFAPSIPLALKFDCLSFLFSLDWLRECVICHSHNATSLYQFNKKSISLNQQQQHNRCFVNGPHDTWNFFSICFVCFFFVPLYLFSVNALKSKFKKKEIVNQTANKWIHSVDDRRFGRFGIVLIRLLYLIILDWDQSVIREIELNVWVKIFDLVLFSFFFSVFIWLRRRAIES